MKTYIKHDGKYVAEFFYNGELIIYYSDSKKDAIAFNSFRSASNFIHFVNTVKTGFVRHCILV